MTPGEIERRLRRARLSYGHGTKNAHEEAAWLLSKKDIDLEAVLRRRIHERIPLAYLLHEAWLGPYRFYIDERAIVPRSFIAELLRERLRPWLRNDPKRALDLCTGSGCLAVLLALTFRKCRVDASDISREALQVARINARGHRIRLIRSDLFGSIRQKYDLIVCNPPYVPAREMRKLPKEYRREPRRALAGGADGLTLIRKILSGAKKHLNPGGLLVCEVGGGRRALERAYPRLAFSWPEVSDPGAVFILEREHLPPGARSAAATRNRPRRARARR